MLNCWQMQQYVLYLYRYAGRPVQALMANTAQLQVMLALLRCRLQHHHRCMVESDETCRWTVVWGLSGSGLMCELYVPHVSEHAVGGL